MTCSTQNHRFPTPCDHFSLPCGLSFEIFQFADMMHFHMALLGPTPLADLCKEAFSQLRSRLVHHRWGFLINAGRIDRLLMQVSCGSDQFVFPGRLALLGEGDHILPRSSLQAPCHLLQCALPFIGKSSEKAFCRDFEHLARVKLQIVGQGIISQKSSDFRVVDQ